jgi:hypothetical protein
MNTSAATRVFTKKSHMRKTITKTFVTMDACDAGAMRRHASHQISDRAH